jgi:protein-tyrosine phosphatase
MPFADIHTHLIPELDDGPASLQETLQMLRIAYEGGTRAMVATPHMFFDMFPGIDMARVKDAFARTVEAIRQKAAEAEHSFVSEMELALGSENYASPEFTEALARNCAIPINGGRYLLVEFSPFLPFSMVEVVLKRVVQASYIPIVAHTERILPVQEKPGRVLKLAHQGCVFQVNASSFMDIATNRLRKTAQSLASEGCLHVIASDAHGARRRPPCLGEVYQKVSGRYGRDHADRWMWENPKAIIDNRPVR